MFESYFIVSDLISDNFDENSGKLWKPCKHVRKSRKSCEHSQTMKCGKRASSKVASSLPRQLSPSMRTVARVLRAKTTADVAARRTMLNCHTKSIGS